MSTPVYLAGLVVKGRLCLVLGTDPEALVHAGRLLDAGACITLVDPRPREELLNALEAAGLSSRVHVESRAFEASDLERAWLVVDGRRDPAAAESLAQLAERARVLVLAIDQPRACTVTGVALVRRGPLHVGVSTQGVSPLFAGWLRRALDTQLGHDLGAFVERLGVLREKTPREQRRSVIARAMEGFNLRVTYSIPNDEEPEKQGTP